MGCGSIESVHSFPTNARTMTLEILIRYFHFITIIGMFSAIVVEHLLLKDTMTVRELKRMATIDGIYGLLAILLVAAGLTLWFGVGKPAEFYTKNWIFHTKVTVVIIVALLSIIPTVFFLKNRKGEDLEQAVAVPKRIKMIIRLELLLLLIVPLLATLMAKGIGYFG